MGGSARGGVERRLLRVGPARAPQASRGAAHLSVPLRSSLSFGATSSRTSLSKASMQSASLASAPPALSFYTVAIMRTTCALSWGKEACVETKLKVSSFSMISSRSLRAGAMLRSHSKAAVMHPTAKEKQPMPKRRNAVPLPKCCGLGVHAG